MKAKWLGRLLLSVLVLASAAVHAEAIEGKHYKKLAQVQPVAVPGKLEVIEFFWYACSHCRNIEPYVESWAKKLPADVNFRRVHAVWTGRPDMEAHAKIFLGLQAMGHEGKYQQAVFDAIQRERIELRDDKALNGWLKKQGIDQAKFRAGYDGFSIGLLVNKQAQLTKQYNVDAVPTFFVNGKYTTSPSMAGAEDGSVLRVIDELLAKERQSGGKKK